MKPYPIAEELLDPVLRVATPRAARLYAPGGNGPLGRSPKIPLALLKKRSHDHAG